MKVKKKQLRDIGCVFKCNGEIEFPKMGYTKRGVATEIPAKLITISQINEECKAGEIDIYCDRVEAVRRTKVFSEGEDGSSTEDTDNEESWYIEKGEDLSENQDFEDLGEVISNLDIEERDGQ